MEGGRGGRLGEGGRDGGRVGGEGGWGREGGTEGGGGREGGREGGGRNDYYYSNRCVHIHSMHFIVGPMPSEIGTRISLTRYLLISCIFIQVHHHHFISELVNHLKMERIHMVHHYDKNHS